MRKEFSKKWESSTQARKQRKFRANAPLNKKRKFISSHLNKDLKKKYGKRSFPLRKGDDVKVMVGKFKGKTGKILKINKFKLKVYIEGLQRAKVDGSKVNVPFDPSNLLITNLELLDKKRVEAINRK